MSRLLLRAGTACFLLAALPFPCRAAPPPAGPAADVPALIDRLADVASGDVGYSPSVSGSKFSPLDREGRVSVALLLQEPNASSETVRAIVKRGAAAVPHLLAHLDDRRPTKMTVRHDGRAGGMLVGSYCDTNPRTAPPARPGEGADEGPDPPEPDENRHTLTVGDLCFAALGQIVNRDFSAVGYMPTAFVLVSSPTRSPVLCAEVRRQWQGLTPAKHRASLLADFQKPDHEDRRVGACKRLAYYYPDAFEQLAPEVLRRPTYDADAGGRFVRDRLYAAADARERRLLFDAYLAGHGPETRDGILLQLFDDLEVQESAEAARRCLVQLYGLPKTVKGDDRPPVAPLTTAARARLIEEGMVFDDSEKVDRAFRDYLAGDPDDDVAVACLKRLVGRGYDADIERFCRRRKDRADCQELLDRLGWTPLHVAVDRGDPDLLRSRLARGARPDAADRRGRTPLHLAAEAGDWELVRILLGAKAPVDAKDGTGRTPAQLASDGDHAGVVRLLGEHGCSAPDVFVAAALGKVDRLAALLRADAGALRRENACGWSPLFLAVREGRAEAVRLLLGAGAAVNSPEEKGETPLHAAAARGDAGVVRLLLRAGADVRRRAYGDGPEPLHLAAEGGNAKAAELLLAHKADPNSPLGIQQLRPLHLAVGAGSVATASALLAHGARVDAADADGKTPLYHAVDAGRADLVRLLLEHGAGAGVALTAEHLLPLHLAARQGSREVLEVLLAARADVKARTRRADTVPGVGRGGATPLHEAARFGRAEAARTLLGHGADVNALEDVLPSMDEGSSWIGRALGLDFIMARWLTESRDPLLGPGGGMTALHTASRYGRAEVVRVLLDHKADVNARVAATGATALHLAAANGHAAVAELLLDRGAKVDAANAGGGTPLHLALARKRRRVVELLLSHKADPNAVDLDGMTPLHHAAGTGDAALVRTLLDRGVARDARSEGTGLTPLHRAAAARDPGAARLLLDRGASARETSADGKTPLHLAGRGSAATVDLLLSHGAVVNARDRAGRTPLHAAAERGNAAAVERLLARGADPDAKDAVGKKPLDVAEPGLEGDVVPILKDAAAKREAPR
jgi:ankyrin repeat protein